MCGAVPTLRVDGVLSILLRTKAGRHAAIKTFQTLRSGYLHGMAFHQYSCCSAGWLFDLVALGVWPIRKDSITGANNVASLRRTSRKQAHGCGLSSKRISC